MKKMMIVFLGLFSMNAFADTAWVCSGAPRLNEIFEVKVYETTTSIPPILSAEVVRLSSVAIYAPVEVTQIKTKVTRKKVTYSAQDPSFSLAIHRFADQAMLPPTHRAVLKFEGRKVQVDCIEKY